MRSRIAAVVNIALLCAVVTSGAFTLGTPQRAAACDCAAFTDTEAYEFADVVFTGTLVEISGPGPFVVFARLDDDGNARNAVEGEVYSNSCSGTHLLDDGALPTSFGTPSPPVTVAATGEASSPPASSANGSSGDGPGSRRSSECSCSEREAQLPFAATGAMAPRVAAPPVERRCPARFGPLVAPHLHRARPANRSDVSPGCAIGVCRWIYRRRWAPASRAATIAWERSSTQSFARMMLT